MKLLIDEQNAKSLQDAIMSSVAERRDLVLLIPAMPEVVEQVPRPHAIVDGHWGSIILDASQGTQQGNDVIEYQNEDAEFSHLAAMMEVQHDEAKPMTKKLNYMKV